MKGKYLLIAIFRSNLCIKLIEQQNYCTHTRPQGANKHATMQHASMPHAPCSNNNSHIANERQIFKIQSKQCN